MGGLWIYKKSSILSFSELYQSVSVSHLLISYHYFPLLYYFLAGIFTSHSVLFANLIGPPGLLLHWVTCLVTGKGFGDSNEALEDDN